MFASGVGKCDQLSPMRQSSALFMPKRRLIAFVARHCSIHTCAENRLSATSVQSGAAGLTRSGTGMLDGVVDDQRIVWAKGFGFANPKDNTPATAEIVYRVGSVSKLFTDIAVMAARRTRNVRSGRAGDSLVPRQKQSGAVQARPEPRSQMR
jgi:hypothetical protein